MARPGLSILPAAAVGWVAIGAAAICLSAAEAKDDCLAGPNATSPAGSHWYYRLELPAHRKCWYLGPVGKGAHATQSEVASRSEASEARSDRATPSLHARQASRLTHGAVTSSRPPPLRPEALAVDRAQSVIDDIFSTRGPDPGLPDSVGAVGAESDAAVRPLVAPEARNDDLPVQAPAHKVFAASTGIARPLSRRCDWWA